MFSQLMVAQSASSLGREERKLYQLTPLLPIALIMRNCAVLMFAAAVVFGVIFYINDQVAISIIFLVCIPCLWLYHIKGWMSANYSVFNSSSGKLITTNIAGFKKEYCLNSNQVKAHLVDGFVSDVRYCFVSVEGKRFTVLEGRDNDMKDIFSMVVDIINVQCLSS